MGTVALMLLAMSVGAAAFGTRALRAVARRIPARAGRGLAPVASHWTARATGVVQVARRRAIAHAWFARVAATPTNHNRVPTVMR
jgi:hypothetical protein